MFFYLLSLQHSHQYTVITPVYDAYRVGPALNSSFLAACYCSVHVSHQNCSMHLHKPIVFSYSNLLYSINISSTSAQNVSLTSRKNESFKEDLQFFALLLFQYLKNSFTCVFIAVVKGKQQYGQ
jgi:hypothetical protein